MAMLCLLVSGVIIHHKLFSEFFTLRLHRAFGRSTLDVHNVASVALLPFRLLITLSGLMLLGVATLIVALTLSWRAQWLALLWPVRPQAERSAD